MEIWIGGTYITRRQWQIVQYEKLDELGRLWRRSEKIPSSSLENLWYFRLTTMESNHDFMWKSFETTHIHLWREIIFFKPVIHILEGGFENWSHRKEMISVRWHRIVFNMENLKYNVTTYGNIGYFFKWEGIRIIHKVHPPMSLSVTE